MTGRSTKLVSLFVLFLVGIILPQVGGYKIPRHVDPEALLSEKPSPVQLFSVYSSVFHSVATGNYSRVYELMEVFEDVYIPVNARGSIEDYNALIGEIAERFKSTEEGLDESWHFLRWLQDDQAQHYLGEALRSLSEADSSVAMLADSSDDLASLFDSAPVVLLLGVDELRVRMDEFNDEIFQVSEAIEDTELLKMLGLEATELVLDADLESVFVGERLRVYGILKDADGYGLAGKEIELFFESRAVGVTVTDEDGSFSFEFETPFLYQEEAVLSAEFWPAEIDSSLLAPCRSNSVVMLLVYYSPVIEVQVPAQGYPSKSIRVSGAVTHSGNSLAGLPIVVEAFGRVESTITDSKGGFEMEVTVPVGLSNGAEDIVVESQPFSVYGPSRVVSVVEITRYPIVVEFDKPVWTFSGGNSRISGNVSVSGGPLRDCFVEIRGDDKVTSTTTFRDGSFVAYLEFPVTELSSKYGYTLRAQPVEPWIGSFEYSGSLLVVNVVTLFCLPVVLEVVIFNYLGRSILKKRAEKEESASDVMDDDFEVVSIPKGGMVGLYTRALDFVSRVTRIDISPSNTIREYLELVKERLGSGVYKVFERLSLLYERWIYGRPQAKPPLEPSERLLDEMAETSEDES